MLIVNADDWGRTPAETDAALNCYRKGRITSTTAMVFMEDSSRAAKLARDSQIDVGLHLNFSQPFTGKGYGRLLQESHSRIVRFLTGNKYSLLIYNPALRKDFRYVYQLQLEEFLRLYERKPTHIDGHHHLHLCTNMLLDHIIPKGEKVRRSFTFGPGEKNILNRIYRRIVDRLLASRYRITDYFFPMGPNIREARLKTVCELSQDAAVEIMTHPVNKKEYDWIMSDEYFSILQMHKTASYTLL